MNLIFLLKIHFRLYYVFLMSSFFMGHVLNVFSLFCGRRDRFNLFCFVLLLKFAHVEHLDVVASKSFDTVSQ